MAAKSIISEFSKIRECVYKDEKCSLYEEELLSYNKAKAIMYRYKVKTDEEIEDQGREVAVR